MAYGVMPYLVDQKRFDSLFGSKDKMIIENIKIKKQRRIESLKDLLDEDPVLYLKDIVNGAIKHDSGALYAYCLELFFDTYGVLLGNSAWCPTNNWSFILNNLPLKRPFGFPYPDDFPEYGVLHPDDMKEVLDEIGGVDEIDDKAKNQLSQWLKRGIETEKVLGLFYY